MDFDVASHYFKLLSFYGAENETRTRDPDLGKVVLYQLSYFRVVLVHFFSQKRVQKYILF